MGVTMIYLRKMTRPFWHKMLHHRPVTHVPVCLIITMYVYCMLPLRFSPGYSNSVIDE